MKTFFLNAFCLLGMAAFLGACGGDTETRQPSTDSTQTTEPASAKLPATVSLALQKILQPERGGLLRGVNLGDSVGRVMRLETAPLTEDSATYKGFNEVLTEGIDGEFADVLYRTDAQGRVVSIHVDVFLNQRAGVDKLLAELQRYFGQRYGTPQGTPQRNVWNLPQGQQLKLSAERVKQAPGLTIEFSGPKKTVQ
ncbi:MAG: hypothetical protein LH606_12920 [Cytophagaceae bacterium]|nr:hypothetical protein [Cytophagaceae bacterium]